MTTTALMAKKTTIMMIMMTPMTMMMVMTNLNSGDLATHRSHFDFFSLHRCHLVEGDILSGRIFLDLYVSKFSKF